MGLLSQHYGELGFTGFGGVVEGGAFAVAFGGAEEESLTGAFGQADEAGFAVGVGSGFEIELVEVQKSVGNADADGRGIDRFISGVGYGEIGCAGTLPGIDFCDGFGVDRGCGDGRMRTVEDCQGQQGN